VSKLWAFGWIVRVCVVLGVGTLATACGSSGPAPTAVHHTAPTITTSITTPSTNAATTPTPGATASSTSPPKGPVTTHPASTTTSPKVPMTTAPGSTTTVPVGTVISSRSTPSYGDIVTDGAGRTLYLYTPDEGQSSPQCTSTAGCSSTWPPLKAMGTPRAEGAAQPALLGAEDGQVTYNGHPLYYYAGDSGAGQTSGEGVGGIWYVVSTSGSPVF